MNPKDHKNNQKQANQPNLLNYPYWFSSTCKTDFLMVTHSRSQENFLHTGKMRDLTDIMRHIGSLTAADLQQVAVQLFHPDRVLTLIYD